MQQPLPVADAPDRNRPIRIQPADAIFIYQTFYKPERKGIVDMRGIRNFTGNAKRIRCICCPGKRSFIKPAKTFVSATASG